MFKCAYTRGIALALTQSGHVQFNDVEQALKTADYIGERVDFDPTKPVPADVTRKIAGHLAEASQILAKQPGFKAAAFNKIENWDEVAKIASDNAVHLMELAQSKTAEGSTIEGGDKGNDEPQTPHGEAKMDLGSNYRPMGYATDSRGKTDVDTRPGAVGKEEEHPKEPQATDKKDNSVEEQSRTASLRDIMRKIAEGSTIEGGDKKNMQADSAHAESKMDAAWRPQGYATYGMKGVGSLGDLMAQAKGTAGVGHEAPHPMQPGASDKKPNSVQETTSKHGSDDPYVVLFKKTASEVIEHIPAQMGEEEKIAHVRACMGLNLNEKARYLTGLQKEAQAKTAAVPAEVPPGSRGDKYMNHSPEATHSRPGAYDGRSGNQAKSAEDGHLPPFMMKKDEKDEKKDDEKDEKKDDGEKKDLPPWLKDEKEKEAAMRDHLKRLIEATQSR